MNTLKHLALIFLISLSIIACDDDTEMAVEITEEEAVEAIENSLSADTEGMTAQASESARMADTYVDCTVTFDSTITHTSTFGSITYDYTFNWNGSLQCTNRLPSQLDLEYTMSGNYVGPRMSSTDNANASIEVTGLSPTTDQYIMNGTYTRNGTQIATFRDSRTFSSTITIIATNWLIDKDTQMIDDGNATVTITGLTNDGTTFSFTGTLIFLGNRSATLSINGNDYPISW